MIETYNVIKTLPILFGKSSTGKIKEWEIGVVEKDNRIYMRTSHGQKTGKKIEEFKEVKSGKNIGRSNETTTEEQAILESISKWNKKKDKNYHEDSNQIGKNIRPMLAMEYKKRKHDIVWPAYAQPKLNGVRCIAHKLSDTEMEYISRNSKRYHTLRHLDKQLLETLRVGDMVDGEIFNPDLTFQQIIKLVKREKNIDFEETKQLQYWVYDLCDENLAFYKRKNEYHRMFGNHKNSKYIKAVNCAIVQDEAEVKVMQTTYTENGFEGTIIRNSEGMYKFDYRSKDLQKYKEFVDEEFLIVGGKDGEGKDEGAVIFKCKASSGKKFDVRPRGNYKYRQELYGNLSKIIGKKLTVRYQNLSDDGVPIFPVGLVIRDYE